MSFQRFCEILFNQELVLVKPEMWNDKYESYIYHVIQNPDGEAKLNNYLKEKYSADDEKIRLMKWMINQICKTTHCLCFSASVDAEVMWNAYNYNSQAIMLKTTDEELDKLSKSIEFEIRKVKYDLEDSGVDSLFELLKTDDKGVQVSATHNFFTHKRKCFEYENEFRIIVSSPKSSEKRFLSYHIDDLSVFIKGVMVHPLASDSYVSLIEKMCNTFNVKFLGKSSIYDFNVIY